ncbi:MAG: HlyD family type I secretion periplasmic adaptor subunit [Geminicoccaceae bacterium]
MNDQKSMPNSTRRPFPILPILAGLLTIVAFAGGLAAWAYLAPIESAVVSPGVVSVASYRKTIQHLEGGIVKEILVKDGDPVEQGQLLIQLSNVQPSAEAKQLRGQHAEARAIAARLLAERDDRPEIAFPDDLIQLAKDESSIRSILKGQDGVFASRRKNLDDRLSVFRQQIEQTKAEIAGLDGQIRANGTQLDLAREGHREIRGLYEQNLIPKPRMLELEGRIAELEGAASKLRSAIARERKSILETEVQMGELKTQRIAEITEALRAERARIHELSQQLVAAEDVLSRTDIRSPIDGVVVNLQVHTQDGVIAAGQPLLEVVPSSDELVVEALIDPEDIEEVRAGLPAHVQLTSINRRRRTPIEGEVSAVSADRLTDEQTGEDFYRARIELDPQSLAGMDDTLLAGMGADVFIRTGARTPLEYLLDPITRNLQLGLREN